MKTATLLSLSALTLALSGCVINVNAQTANVQLEEHLSIQADTLKQFDIDAGAGFLVIQGDESATNINVQAEIRTTDEKNFILTLDRSGSTARLVAKHKSHAGFWQGSSPKIDLTITMPSHLMLDIDDGSGEIEITNIANDVRLEDGSGGAKLTNIKGSLDIDDGSGELIVRDVQGNVDIQDGSGGLTITNVAGNIDVDDGSGELTVKDVTGKVTIDDGSGGINVMRAGALKIIDSGSGGLSIAEIKGEVDIDS